MTRRPPPGDRAVLGGTFDRFHAGHAALLRAAFATGLPVAIGVATDRFVARRGKPGARTIQPYSVRAAGVRRFVRREFPRRSWQLVPLDDPFGRSTGPGVGVLIVSAETAGGGARVNTERRRLGRLPVPIVEVPLVLADDLRPIASRRIRLGEIDRRGRRVGPIRIGLAATDRQEIAPASRAVRDAFPAARVAPRVLRTNGPAANQAARLAERALARQELGIGIARTPGGWSVALRSREVELRARRLPGSSVRELRRGVAALLRPRRAQPL